MAIQVTPEEFNRALSRLKSSWRIYAPKAEYRGGRFSDTDNIIYQSISSWQEIVWREKSHMSPNAVITPITETLFYFNQNTIQIADVDTRPMLIFARACDINAMSRLDRMYLENGSNTDYSYQLMRNNIRFVLIECETSFENCFCVSMDSNRTDNYSAAIRFSEEKALIDVKDESLLPFFEGIGQPCDYTPEFITENAQTVVTPDQVCSDPQKIRDIVVNHPLWTTYDSRCISCGRCTTGCPTCTCYSIFDVPYEENPRQGERRRQWSSCLVPGFGDMAGGHVLRSTPGERLRYRALHKINDFKDRHGDEHMCVGCGRCEDRCPQYIKFSLIINKITDAVRVSVAEEETNQ